MKKSVLLFSMYAILFISWRDNGTEVEQVLVPPESKPLTTLEKAVVTSDNSFGLKLFAGINQTDQNKNVFISPFSVSMALGMALNGAGGATLDSMKKVLEHSNFTLQELNESYRSISALLEGLDPKVIMNIANSVWHRNSFQVYPTFLDACRTYFDADVASLDFASPTAVQTINTWVNSKTNGKIPTILDNIPSDAVMYLINAIYFKGIWKYQFDPATTSDATVVSPTGNSPCRMMSQRARYAYRSTGSEQVIDMAYGDGHFSMLVILPQQGLSIDQYATSLTQEKWDELSNGMDSMDVELYMPKFKLEYEKTLNNELVGMGMGNAFFVADFSRIAAAPLEISEVKHKTFVEVNEEGTEAAAVTSIGIRLTSAEPSIPTMRIDHPFICAITEHATGTILFLGKIVSPTSS